MVIKKYQMLLMLNCFFDAVIGVALNETAAISALERGQRAILNRMGHVTVWRFPQGPMALGCLIMAAGVALGVCIMCIWMHYQWREMTQGAAVAIQNILRMERRNAEYTTELYTPLSAIPNFDETSLVAEATVLGAPPAYDEVI